MGQQQLLLLVLSTVIVGLATVAGIQAFSENQKQATQDALVQRAISLGNDLAAAHDKPSQLGGIDIGNTSNHNVADVDAALGVSDHTDISADGAGDSAKCTVDDGSTSETVKCGSGGLSGSGSGVTGDVQVTVDVNPSADDPVTVNSITVQS